MEIEYKNNTFFVKCDVSENEICKKAGFKWNKALQLWQTPFIDIAKKVITDKREIELRYIDKNERIRNSFASESKANYTAKAPLTYKPFQVAGIETINKINNVLLADEMGLGKTAQAIGFLNLHPKSWKKVLIVCPASLKLNWQKEFSMWSELDLSIGIAKGPTFPDTDIVIINYDIYARHIDKMHSIAWDCVILDECHLLKSSKAMRKMSIFGGRKTVKGESGNRYIMYKPLSAKKKILITGTPILNMPIELFNLLQYIDPIEWNNKMQFAWRYCGGKRGPFGWDMKGASNLEELQDKLRSTVMIRRMKADVLKDLPSKTRQIIEFDINKSTKKMLSIEKKHLIKVFGSDKKTLNDAEYNAIVKTLTSNNIDMYNISATRKENALMKVPMAIEHLENVIESGKVVCFAHHKDVVKKINEHFKDISVVVNGETSMENRQKNVDLFQKNEKIKLFIGNIQAAGVGLTLTAASLVVFVELDWVPGNVTQAEDRCHRIGQVNNVLVQHLVVRDSIDCLMANYIVNKQNIIDESINVDVTLQNILK